MSARYISAHRQKCSVAVSERVQNPRLKTQMNILASNAYVHKRWRILRISKLQVTDFQCLVDKCCGRNRRMRMF